MRTQTMHKWILVFSFLAVGILIAAPVSRVTNFVDGQTLTASQLNTEFNNVIGGVNSITNAQVATNAQISASKLSASIKGDSILRDATTGSLSVKVDDTSIEIDADNLAIKDGGVTTAKILDANVTTAKILDANVTTAKLADASVTQAKLAALNIIYSSSSSNFSTSSTSMTDVTNLSVSFTSTGRPVMLTMISASTSTTVSVNGVRVNTDSTASAASLFFDRSGSTISNQLLSSSLSGVTTTSLTAYWPCSAFSHIDTPGAGTFTYKVRVRNGVIPGAFNTTYVDNCKLVAYEL